MNTLIMTNMFKQASSCAQTAEDKSIRLRVAPQLYAVTRASKALLSNKALFQFGVISARFSSICTGGFWATGFFVPENGGGDQGRGTFRLVVPPERIARTFPAFPTAENRRKW